MYYIIIISVGEEEELKALLLGASDLEKKLQRALDEIRRLHDKTEKLINRERERELKRKQKLLEEAQKNEALKVLVENNDKIDQVLSDLRAIQTNIVKAEEINRKISGMNDSEEVETK